MLICGRRTHVPARCLHRPNGQAVVTFAGTDIFLGPQSSKDRL